MKKVFPSAILLLILGLISFQMQSCKGNRDVDIQNAIASETQNNPNLAGVSAIVVNGVVTLTGQCEDEDCRKSAEKAVKKIDGVKDITNNITVTSSVTIRPDEELREDAEKIISKYKNVQAGVSNGIITLRGEVKKDKLPELMMALSDLHPKRIENQLVVK